MAEHGHMTKEELFKTAKETVLHDRVFTSLTELL